MEYIHLTTPQQNIWNLQKYYANSAIANLCGAVFFQEKRDGALLQEAVRQFILNQSGIRLRFCEENEPRQYISEKEEEEIPDLTFHSREMFECYAENFAKEPIGLLNRQMYHFVVFHLEQEHRSGVLLAISHLISDAWTFGLIVNQLDAAYRRLSGETDISLLKGKYQDFVRSEEAYFKSERYGKDRDYWERKYGIRPEECPVKVCQMPVKSVAAKRITRILPCSLEQKMAAYCKRHSVTQAVLFETALVIYLFQINPNVHSVTIGVPVLNRSNVIEKEIAGMFVSTMPLTVELTDCMEIPGLAKQISKEHMNLFRHQKYPYAEILRSLREKHNFQGNLYDVMISYQNAKTKTGADTKWYSNGCSEVPLLVHIDNRDGRDCHTINVDYQTAVFQDEQEVEYFIDRLEYILEQIAEEQGKRMDEIQIVPQQEYDKIVHAFNDTYVDYPRNQCVHELFMEQAEKAPDQIALVFEDKKFTYRQLDEMSDSLACFLREKGVKSGSRVAVMLKRDERVIMMQLAVLKLGAVFIPVDSRYPRERVLYILSESDAEIMVTNRENRMDVPVRCDIEDWDMRHADKTDAVRIDAEEPCYVIFTSGSTGRPKGCVLTNRGIVNFCRNNNILEACNRLEEQICVSVNTISFDFFIAESLLPLSNGYTVVLASEEESMDQGLFAKIVVENRVNIVQTTPTRYKLYFSEKGDLTYTEQLRVIVTSGESLPLELLRRFVTNKQVTVFNPLGPSECSVWATGGELDLNKETIMAADITIGRPIANTQVYILDGDKRPLPVGVPGELCIAGEGVGKGYLNRPELTAEKFVENPFATEKNHHGTILYHTGDLARWRADGVIEYLGRIDTQVKIRGLRIELGETESVIGSMEGISLAAAADKRDENGRQYLVGYYTADHKLDEKKLREYLKEKLPRYMVPNYLMRLDTIPVTASGKMDRNRLPVPDFSQQRDEYLAPVSEREKELCHLMEEVLHIEQVGMSDDFFALGGDSLTAIEFLAKAHDKGIEFGLQSIFDYPTVQKLCDYIEQGEPGRVCYKAEDFDAYQYLLAKNIIDETCMVKKKSLGNILLTGATGFLGAHVLDQLMREETGKIYCLVRSDSLTGCCERLRRTLQYYFDGRYESELDQRIISIEGDIEKEMMAKNLPQDVQTIIHTAASVKHYGSYNDFKCANVDGTEHVITYAKSVGARLIHISTISVSGNSLADDFTVYRSEEEKFFSEMSLYIGQPLDNVYTRSKFEAELAVYNAMLGGLDAKVIRVGNLTNRLSDYRFQPNYRQNAFLMRVKAILEFGLFPDYLMPLYSEFSPIDKTAEGIVKIAQYADRQTVFHLNSNRPIYYDKLLNVVHELGIPMKVVDGAVFYQALRQTIWEQGREYIFEAFQNDMDDEGRLVYDSNIRIENDFTVWFLKKTGFEWNETDAEYMKGYIEYFREIGYLDV